MEGVERGSMAAYVSEWNVGVKFHTASGQLDGIKGVHRVFMGGGVYAVGGGFRRAFVFAHFRHGCWCSLETESQWM